MVCNINLIGVLWKESNTKINILLQIVKLCYKMICIGGGGCMDIKIGDTKTLDATRKNVKTIDRYPALRTISLIYKYIGYLVITMVLIIFITLILDKKTTEAILILLGSSILILAIFAFSEFIHLFIDIEENTRQRK